MNAATPSTSGERTSTISGSATSAGRPSCRPTAAVYRDGGPGGGHGAPCRASGATLASANSWFSAWRARRRRRIRCRCRSAARTARSCLHSEYRRARRCGSAHLEAFAQDDLELVGAVEMRLGLDVRTTCESTRYACGPCLVAEHVTQVVADDRRPRLRKQRCLVRLHGNHGTTIRAARPARHANVAVSSGRTPRGAPSLHRYFDISFLHPGTDSTNGPAPRPACRRRSYALSLNPYASGRDPAGARIIEADRQDRFRPELYRSQVFGTKSIRSRCRVSAFRWGRKRVGRLRRAWTWSTPAR